MEIKTAIVRIIVLAILLSAQTVWSQTAIDSSKIVKVLSFNILHGATSRGDFDLDVIAKVIIDADPDLVALQEVDFKTNRARKYDLATELGWRTKMVPVFARAMDWDGGEYGEGILSRYSFLQSRNVALPYTLNNEPRAAIEIIVILESGDTIAFIGTHLDHLEDEKDRVAQVKKIDYVMFHPENKWKILKTEVIQDSIASDHCAYLVTLELLTE